MGIYMPTDTRFTNIRTSKKHQIYVERVFWKLFGILKSLIEMASSEELGKKISTLENKNRGIKKVTDDIRKLVIQLETRVSNLENGAMLVPKLLLKKKRRMK